MIEKYISLLDQSVVVTCTTGKTVRGKWIDCLDAEDAGEDERQEDSILIQNGDELIEVYESEIKAIQKAPDSSPIFQRVNLRAPQLKRDTGDRGAPQKQ